MSGHPDARTFGADRLLESERLALAAAAGPLALLVTQIGTLSAAADWIKALATVAFLGLIYCCIWQVYIVNYATYWLASERLRDEAAPGRRLLDSIRADGQHTEGGLARLIGLSKLHYSVAYWIGGGAGAAAVIAVIWS